MSTRKYLAVLAVAIILAAGGLLCGPYGREIKSAIMSIGGSRSVAIDVLDYAIDPRFTSADLLGQLTGTKVELETVAVDEGKVYFSLPQSEDWMLSRGRLSKRPEAVELSQSKSAPYELGKLALSKRDVFFFRMNVADFKIDPNARISIPFKCASYDPSACELVNFLADRVLFCGKETFAIDGASCMSNFGAKVTIPREPSLSRLTKKIVGGEKNPGRVAQKLLDFVTDEIEYDHDEKEWSDCRQVAKRANEVLMTRRATCASKAALYASLLEQVGIDYILAYYPNHLAVFVIGEYPDGHSIVFSGRRWFFAESTCPGFVIGETKLDTADFSPENDWTHIQRPKDKKIPEARKPPLR